MKNRSDKEMIRTFTEFTTDFKSCGINPGLYFMDNKALTVFKMAIPIMEIKYQLDPPSNHRAENTERYIQTFKNHFIAVIYSVDKDFHLQLWDRLLQK